MKFAAIASVLSLTAFVAASPAVTTSSASTAAAASACKTPNDKCGAVVKGSGSGPAKSSRLADCGSYLATTYTPPPTTTTVLVLTDVSYGNTKRAAAATTATASHTIPSYARSSCTNNGAAYGSACSCAGVTPSTSTAPRETRTVTSVSTYATYGYGGAQCNTLLVGPNQSKPYFWKILCGKKVVSATAYSTATVANDRACVDACDNDKPCYAADFESRSGNCRFFEADTQQYADAVGFDAIDLDGSLGD